MDISTLKTTLTEQVNLKNLKMFNFLIKKILKINSIYFIKFNGNSRIHVHFHDSRNLNKMLVYISKSTLKPFFQIVSIMKKVE